MENRDNATIPYFAHESMTARMERIIKRLVIMLVISLVVIFASNAFWLWAWIQYDYSGEAITVDSTDGIANYIGGDGGITNGKNIGSEEQTD